MIWAMIDNAPLFSIVTVTKNNLCGLRETAQSIVAQTCSAYEWIVIDGDSADGTQDYLSSSSAQWLSEQDGGIYDAMNNGISRACGDYILFLNAGDCLSDPDILSTISKAIDFENPDFIYGDALESNGFYKKARSHIKAAWGMFTHHQAMYYRRDRIIDFHYNTHYKIAADYDFTLRFLKRASIAHYIPAALCIFKEGGLSQTNAAQGRKEEREIRKAHGVGLATRATITAKQSIAAKIKHAAPSLYRRLR